MIESCRQSTLRNERLDHNLIRVDCCKSKVCSIMKKICEAIYSEKIKSTFAINLAFRLKVSGILLNGAIMSLI